MAPRNSLAARWTPPGPNGFTLVELLVVVALIAGVATIALPAFNSCYEGCCIKAAVAEIVGMIHEAKQNALVTGNFHAVGFDTANRKVSLISDKGKDNKWNTADDRVIRSFRLAENGGGLSFGYGEYGPMPGLGAAEDGVSFQNGNALICNPELTGSAGTVYLITRGGRAMAIKMNSNDYGSTIWRWDRKKWVRI